MTHLKLHKLQKGDYVPTSTSPKCQCAVEYHLFVIFAVLDVSFAVNSCLNRSFFTFIFAVLLHFCSCYTWYRVRGMEYVIPTIFEVLL